MGTNTTLIAIATFAAGAIATYLVTRLVTPRHAQRDRLEVDLANTGTIDPSRLGLPGAGLFIGGRSLEMIWVLKLEVRNTGPRDIVPDDATDPPSGTRPRIDFEPGIKVPFDPTPVDHAAAVDVRIARQRTDSQHLHVHVHRLPKGATAGFQVIATDEPGSERARFRKLSGEHVSFYRGAMTDLDVRCQGLVTPPPGFLDN